MGKPARMLQHPVLAHKNGQEGDIQDSLTLNDDVSIGMTRAPVGFHVALLQRLFNEQSQVFCIMPYSPQNLTDAHPSFLSSTKCATSPSTPSAKLQLEVLSAQFWLPWRADRNTLSR